MVSDSVLSLRHSTVRTIISRETLSDAAVIESNTSFFFSPGGISHYRSGLRIEASAEYTRRYFRRNWLVEDLDIAFLEWGGIVWFQQRYYTFPLFRCFPGWYLFFCYFLRASFFLRLVVSVSHVYSAGQLIFVVHAPQPNHARAATIVYFYFFLPFFPSFLFLRGCN